MRSEVPVVVAGTVQVDGAISLQGSVRQLLVPGPEGGELITETGGRSGSHDEQLVPRAHHLLTSTRENCFYDRLGAHLWLIDRRYGLGVAGKHRLAPFELGVFTAGRWTMDIVTWLPSWISSERVASKKPRQANFEAQ